MKYFFMKIILGILVIMGASLILISLYFAFGIIGIVLFPVVLLVGYTVGHLILGDD